MNKILRKLGSFFVATVMAVSFLTYGKGKVIAEENFIQTETYKVSATNLNTRKIDHVLYKDSCDYLEKTFYSSPIISDEFSLAELKVGSYTNSYNDKIVKTGDSTKLLLWISFACASIAAIAACFMVLKKNK